MGSLLGVLNTNTIFTLLAKHGPISFGLGELLGGRVLTC